MDAYLKAALFLAVIAFVVFRSRKKTADANDVEPDNWRDGELEQFSPPKAPTTRVNLTDTQKVALTSAGLGYTIYAEGRVQPGPDELEIYSPRTVDSLVKRGFLEPDGTGGYVITEAGRLGLRSSYGY